MFFQFVPPWVLFWVLLFIVLVYITVVGPIVLWLYIKLMSIATVGDDGEPLPRPLYFRIWVFTAVLLIAPYVRYKIGKEIRRKRAKKKSRHSLNLERERRRAEWLSKNSLTVYYQTINGVTAAMTPAAYEECQRETKQARRDGRWTKNNLLVPSKDAYVFVNMSGDALVAQNLKRSEDLINSLCISGWYADLVHLTHVFDLKLVQKKDIFVPYVNESQLPFSEHTPSGMQPFFQLLIFTQTPVEMWPVEGTFIPEEDGDD